uniref:Uncharacterized protein n=1 Tax=Romanomermis culicivorax TaxID=13658 RepID=A0A915I2J2_ROMCU
MGLKGQVKRCPWFLRIYEQHKLREPVKMARRGTINAYVLW